MTEIEQQPTTLYRLYDKDDQLLYVGIAGNPGRRFEQHKTDKPWWGNVARTALTHFPTRAEAIAAETEAIRLGAPLHNVVGNKRPSGDTTTISGPLLVWPCGVCGQPVQNGEGYIEISAESARRFRAEMRKWRIRHPGGTSKDAGGWKEADLSALLDEPDDQEWRALHADCDPDPDHSRYWFAIERARTVEQLLRWTLHLVKKQWVLEETDWLEFVEHALGRNGHP